MLVWGSRVVAYLQKTGISQWLESGKPEAGRATGSGFPAESNPEDECDGAHGEGHDPTGGEDPAR
jgi:hypothetical protein